jgi:Domain of unknown function (DUF4349)
MNAGTAEPQPTEPGAVESDSAAESQPTGVGALYRRIARTRIGPIPAGGLLAAAAMVAVLGTAYYLGNPQADSGQGPTTLDSSVRGPAGTTVSDGAGGAGFNSLKDAAIPAASPASGETASAPGQVDQLSATLASNLIVKTGSMAIEVADLDKAVSQAQATIVGMGGYIGQSSSSGEKDSATATVEYRVPAARWDDALAAIRALGSKVISSQTNAQDVTTQAVDINARLTNLQATESALQAIMARASAIPDVLAVEQQLSSTQGQIEELSAEQKTLNDQASMSTLTVSFSLPGQTVATQAAQGWDLGSQVDQAGAALIRVGQGLVTIVVWVLVVGLPVGIGLALLWVIFKVGRRIARRRRTAADIA